MDPSSKELTFNTVFLQFFSVCEEILAAAEHFRIINAGTPISINFHNYTAVYGAKNSQPREHYQYIESIYGMNRAAIQSGLDGWLKNNLIIQYGAGTKGALFESCRSIKILLSEIYLLASEVSSLVDQEMQNNMTRARDSTFGRYQNLPVILHVCMLQLFFCVCVGEEKEKIFSLLQLKERLVNLPHCITQTMATMPGMITPMTGKKLDANEALKNMNQTVNNIVESVLGNNSETSDTIKNAWEASITNPHIRNVVSDAFNIIGNSTTPGQGFSELAKRALSENYLRKLTLGFQEVNKDENVGKLRNTLEEKVSNTDLNGLLKSAGIDLMPEETSTNSSLLPQSSVSTLTQSVDLLEL